LSPIPDNVTKTLENYTPDQQDGFKAGIDAFVASLGAIDAQASSFRVNAPINVLNHCFYEEATSPDAHLKYELERVRQENDGMRARVLAAGAVANTVRAGLASLPLLEKPDSQPP
jgi:hypothetical protein